MATLQAQGSAKDAPEHWQEWKHRFFRAQHGRCGWCDVDQTGHVGVVDHVAPKGAVFSLGAPGSEGVDGTHFSKREFEPVHAVGYWWRAYEWENLIFACDRCNAYKSALYPVEEDPHPPPDPKGQAPQPLLLHPFGPEDPLDFLDVDDNGQILAFASSQRGRATIDTCGLDRESLRNKREKVVEDVLEACEALQEGDDPTKSTWLKKALGDDRELAWVARAVVRRELGLDWRTL